MSWYKAGTIAVSGVTVTGTGTNWSDNKMGIGPGQALLIPGSGTVKMYEIARVDSATKITLTSSAGTLAAGQAYAIMSFYTDSVPDFARRLSTQLSYYQSQMDGWQQIMTGSGSVNITAPDGTQVTISSFKKLTDDMENKADKVNGAVAVSQGGTGAKNAADARSNLGLGDMATKSSGETEGAGMTVGTFGIGRPSGIKITNETGSPGLVTALSGYGFIPFRNEQNITGRIAASSPALWVRTGGTFTFLSIPYVSSAPVRISGGLIANGVIDYTRTLYDDLNTTKASDGTLKAASPVARIVNSREENQRTDVSEDGFTWCGCGTVNAEAEGVSISRLDTGVYELTGSAGLASEGWQLLPPMDPAGMGELGVVEAEETESGGITIRLFKRRYMMGEDGDIVKTKGVPIDVPANSWIDIRLDMPEASIWNQRNSAIPEFSNVEEQDNQQGVISS